MKVLKGDNVYIAKGKDRGKSGKVLTVFPKERKVAVEGINIKKRHVRPRKSGEKGQIVDVIGKIPLSNILVVCASCKKGGRIGYEVSENGKHRICKKCKSSV